VRAGQSEQAIAMMGGLSDLLRYSLDRGGGSRVALEEEATMVERYLDIQRLRFADRLEVEIDVTADAARGAVPVLLLQPLAENAIQHGIATSHAPGLVRVRARRDGDDLEIELFNTGRLSPDARHRVGLSTTISRLHHLYGDRGRFELIEREGGVLARVRLPWSPA
jgi:LytS/YehU family sensor histidine kinase